MRMTRSVAWTDPDLETVPAEMRRMHYGAGKAAFTAATLEEFLASSPPLDKELLDLIEAHAEISRRLESQFGSAIANGRTDLNEEEFKIAAECANAEFLLIGEILRRIDYNSLVEVSE